MEKKEKDAAQEAREHECRVRALARHLLNSLVIPGSMQNWEAATALAWQGAEMFEAQAEERWRKLL